jgi:UV DNA damage endonuclease
MLPVIAAAGFRAFRVSSSLFPLADVSPVDPLTIVTIVNALKRIGSWALQRRFRLTTHPGQFVVLSSDDAGVIERSCRELEHHGRVFDAMGLPRTPWAAINVHGGKRGRSGRLIATVKKLSSSIRDRLTLENDEFSYTVMDLAEVSRETGVPVCFDSHHHSFNPGKLDLAEAHELSLATWPAHVRPLQHLSNSEPGCAANPGAMRRHSWAVHHVPDVQRSANESGVIDLSMEFKGKNIAIFAALSRFNLTLAT